jgi:hypothetical protein
MCIGAGVQKENSAKDIYEHMQLSMIDARINPLQTKRRLLYLKTQSFLRCKHFSSRL